MSTAEVMGGNYYLPRLEEYYAYPDYNTGYSRATRLAREDDRSIHSYERQNHRRIRESHGKYSQA